MTAVGEPDHGGTHDPRSGAANAVAPPGHDYEPGVLDRAFQLLEALPDIDGPGQLSELARTTGIPRQYATRCSLAGL